MSYEIKRDRWGSYLIFKNGKYVAESQKLHLAKAYIKYHPIKRKRKTRKNIWGF